MFQINLTKFYIVFKYICTLIFFGKHSFCTIWLDLYIYNKEERKYCLASSYKYFFLPSCACLLYPEDFYCIRMTIAQFTCSIWSFVCTLKLVYSKSYTNMASNYWWEVTHWYLHIAYKNSPFFFKICTNRVLIYEHL